MPFINVQILNICCLKYACTGINSLILHLPLILCMYPGVFVGSRYTCVYRCTCMCVCMWRTEHHLKNCSLETSLVSFACLLLPLVWKEVSYSFGTPPAELDWLGSKLQGANRPCLPRTRITFTILTSLCHKLWRLNSDPTVCIVVPKLSFQPLYH